MSHEDYTATITSVGATLRELRHAGRPLIAGFAADDVRPMSRGALLAPWPNRLADASYRFDGLDLHVPITERERSNAIHGVVGWHDWTLVDHTTAAVTLSTRIVPTAGYPFDVVVEASYALGSDGLRCTVVAQNVGGAAAPYGLGAHPYLVAGSGLVDDWTLSAPADTLVLVDDRLIPTGTAPVSEHAALDFREPRSLAGVHLDHAFTGLHAAGADTFTATVRDAEGSGTGITWDPRVLPWAQVYTSDKPGTRFDRAGLAIEPMSCPADAFNSGNGLVVLAPSDQHEGSWRIFAIA